MYSWKRGDIIAMIVTRRRKYPASVFIEYYCCLYEYKYDTYIHKHTACQRMDGKFKYSKQYIQGIRLKNSFQVLLESICRAHQTPDTRYRCIVTLRRKLSSPPTRARGATVYRMSSSIARSPINSAPRRFFDLLVCLRSREAGTLVGASTFPAWRDVPLAAMVQERTGRPVRLLSIEPALGAVGEVDPLGEGMPARGRHHSSTDDVLTSGLVVLHAPTYFSRVRPVVGVSPGRAR